MWLYVTVLFGDPVDLTQLKLQLETAVTSKKLKEMIYKIKNIVAKEGNLPNGEPLWGRDVEAISSKLYNLCRAERLQWSGSPECPVQVIKYYKGIEAYIRLTTHPRTRL